VTRPGASQHPPLPVKPRPRHGETADSYLRRLATANHVPTVGCPANGSSVRGVKIRTRCVHAGSDEGSTNVLSAKLNSLASCCLRARSFSRVLFRTIHLAVAGGVHIGRADGLRRRALRLQERVGYPVAESQQAGSDQCCRQGAAPPDGVG
jgi:hypothetical protein